MLKINYTYMEPADVPIIRAEFESSYGTNVTIRVCKNSVSMDKHDGIVLERSDFADFTYLVNRINRQLGNENVTPKRESKPFCDTCRHIGVSRHNEPCVSCKALGPHNSRNNHEPRKE